jgi:hypothetical protein
MSTEEVVPQLAANMNAAFKKVWKIIATTNPGDFDLVATRIVELVKNGRLIPLTQVHLYVVGVAHEAPRRFCEDCLA